MTPAGPLAPAARRRRPCLGFFSSLLDAFAARPALRHAGWLVGMVHTRDPVAMAHHNRAIARMGLGRPDAALADLQAAIERDPTYALAHAALAAVLAAREPDEAEAHRRRAVALGLRHDGVEAAVDRMAALLARVEG